MASDPSLKQSPLRAEHLQSGGKLVPFAGWELPVQYTGIVAEHRAVREGVGMFDISHMGQFFLRGTRVVELLDGQLTNRFSALKPGRGQYTLLLNEAGGVIDDLIAYQLAADEVLLVVNAAKIDEDWEVLTQRLGGVVEMENASVDYAGIAVQGPKAAAVFSRLGAGPLPPRNGVAALAGGGFICRTGYTGEDGFELFVPASEGPCWWRKCLEAGVVPCGLGARDSLRLEACYPLNGNDLDPVHSPLEAGLGFAVKLDGREFPGAAALRQQQGTGLPSELCALRVQGKGAPPRAHYPVLHGDRQVGELSSGGFGPWVEAGIGLAYLPPECAVVGTALELDVRGRRVPVEVVKKPFYQRS